MNARNEHPATPRLATSLRVTTIVVVVGTLLASLVTIQPTHSQGPGGIRGGGPPFGPPGV